MPNLNRGRRAVLCSMVAFALAAVTCRTYAFFDLDHVGLVALDANSAATSLNLDGLNDIDLSSHPLMVHQGLTVHDITYAALKGATLVVDKPSTGQDLQFISQVAVMLVADGMQPLTIATGGPFAAGNNLVPLTVTQSLITGYLKGRNATVTLVPTYSGTVPDGVTLGLNMVSQVRVGEPGGSCQN